MTRNEIIDMAIQSEILLPAYRGHTDQLVRFAELVAAKEREACAQVAREFVAKKPQEADRELLGLAAKAAGYADEEWQVFWNPLEDDGDALRLACDLGLRVYTVSRTASGSACSAVGDVTCELLSEVVDASIGIREATRRAIVQAAAEVGQRAA